jgi:hypothetical protein
MISVELLSVILRQSADDRCAVTRKESSKEIMYRVKLNDKRVSYYSGRNSFNQVFDSGD